MEQKHASDRPLRFRDGWKRILSAALLLLCLGALLWYKADLLWQETEQGRLFCGGFLAAYLLLTLLSVLLCFVTTSLPLLARRIIGWAMLLLLPVAVFYGVDLMNGTRILTFPVLRWLGNYLCCLLPFLLCYALTRSVLWPSCWAAARRCSLARQTILSFSSAGSRFCRGIFPQH